MVSSDYSHTSSIEKRIEQSHGDGAPLFGIGPCAKLIEQHEAALCRRGGDVRNDAHVTGKRRERLIYGLLVSDVGKNCIKNCKS